MADKLSSTGSEGLEAAVLFLQRAQGAVAGTGDLLPAMLLAGAYIEQRRFAEAHAVLQDEVLAAAPQSALALNMLGFLHLSSGDARAARGVLEAAARANDSDAGVLQNLAAAHLMLGEHAEAEHALLRCLAANARSPQALHMLARVLRARGLAKEDIGLRINEFVDQHPEIRAEVDVLWAVLWADTSDPAQ